MTLAWPVTARAHQTSMKVLQVEVRGQELALQLTASVADAAAALGDVADGAPAAQVAERVQRADAAAQIAAWVTVRAADAACAAGPAQGRVTDDGRNVAVRWAARCAGATTELTLDLDAFFALDQSHTMLVRVTGGGGAMETLAGAEDTPLRLRLVDAPTTFWHWLRLGANHIFGGADHLAFLLALLLGTAIERAPAPGAWRLRPWRAAVAASAALVSAFTLAHSATLALAALGYLALPPRWVETSIALSIAYAAVETWRTPVAPRRWVAAFLFGLVHGLGFATALLDLLPSARVITPLLAFNLGVEFGQLLIVVLALPLLIAIARIVGARRYRTRVIPLTTAILLALALLWTVERALDLRP